MNPQHDLAHEARLDFETRNGLLRVARQGEPINVDCLDDSDLAIAANHPALHTDVRAYAAMQREARKLRCRGDVEKARRIEDRCDAIYWMIPKALRW